MNDKNQKTSDGPLTFGFDIGIASVGWCVLSETRIVDLGVRAFDKAETAKEGESLNLARRMARLMRRRLRRRAWRLTKLSRLLKREGLIADANYFKSLRAVGKTAWQLRVDALNRKLINDDWAQVIYHLCKHRGFHWVSRAEEKAADGDAKGEGGKVKKGLAATAALMKQKNYQSAAEMVLGEFVKQATDQNGQGLLDINGQPILEGAARNKQGDYGKALSRVALADEFVKLFERQREYGNTFSTSQLQLAILGTGDRKSGLFWAQKPALAGADLLKMLGKCTFEKAEHRAPKASYTAERHVWLTRLNNLRIVIDGTTRGLNEPERRVALPLPYQQAGDLTYKQLHTALVNSGLLPESFEFSGLRGKDGKDPKAEKLIKLPAFQTLRLALNKAGLETEWQSMVGAAASGDPTQLDGIGRALSVFKEDDEVTSELAKLSLPGGEKMINVLLLVRFDKFHALSLKALRKIVPHMEAGMRYDEAVAAIPEYGHHSQLHAVGAGEHKYLPPFYSTREKDGRMVFRDDIDIPRNPVVLRALNQARKVMNALVRQYGSPASVHIEMARDLSRPLDERRAIEKEQAQYRERNEKDRDQFVENFGSPPRAKGGEFEKWRLYREQMGKCAYSIESINLSRLLEPGYVEIDHALPYSRSFDDSKNNKVLVHAKENRDKGNRTPHEYLTSFAGGEDGERWRKYVAEVESNKAYRIAKRSRLLRKKFGNEEASEFRDRNLNDTRYICKFFKNYVERFLQLADDTESKRCVVLSGQLTAFLRQRWGLHKVRSDSDRHHALDAAVVAACSHSMVKRLADYSRTKELSKLSKGFVDLETGEILDIDMYAQLHQHFPEPWAHFRDEVEARLKIDDVALLRTEVERLGSYSPEAIAKLKPLFVSRAPQRRNSGAAHKDTIYAQPPSLVAPGGVTQRIPLSSLKPADLEKLVDQHRNEKLYAAIAERLAQFGGKADKAFTATNPLRKPGKVDGEVGPVVRSVTMVIDKLSGIPIRGGIAKNDTMLRVDVFAKSGKYHLVPVYVHHAVSANGLPNRAVVAFKDEAEWTLIDESFGWCFSLYPNDLVRVALKSELHIGYFSSCDRSTGNISIWVHDRNAAVGKDGQIRTGVKTAQSLEKLNVDVLGNIYPAPPEQRRGLA